MSAVDLLATATGLSAAACLTLAPLARTRSGVLWGQMAAGLSFAAHYALLGITAAAVNAMGDGTGQGFRRIGYVLTANMVLVGLLFWQGPISGLSVLAMALIAIGRMQVDQVALRLLIMAGGAVWLIHDALIGAWIALAADIGALAMGAVGLVLLTMRVQIEWRASCAPILSL